MRYLVKWDLVVRRRGAQLVVNNPARSALTNAIAPASHSISALVAEFLRTAQELGFKEAEVLRHVRDRLTAQPPNRILVVSFDAGMRVLFEEELRTALPYPVACCAPEELLANPEIASSALLVAPPGVLPRIVPVLTKARAVVPALYTDATPYLQEVRRLRNPSILVLISISEAFLSIARGVLGPVVSGLHSLIERQVSETGSIDVPAADIIFCDAVTALRIGGMGGRRNPSKVLPYPLLAADCIEMIRAAMSPT
jgi:hypothetical protein